MPLVSLGNTDNTHRIIQGGLLLASLSLFTFFLKGRPLSKS